MYRADRWLAVALVCVLFAPVATARAEECQLKLYASLDAKFENNQILVPVQINGHDRWLALDTGATWSSLRESISTEEHFKTGRVEDLIGYIEIWDVAGNPVRRYAVAPSFGFGSASWTGTQFLVMPDAELGKAPEAGFLGQNVLQKFDIEIDPARRKVNFFSKDHCSGVVYWNSTYFEIPYKEEGATPYTPAKLDGKPIRASIDTGSDFSSLDIATARSMYGIDPETDGGPDATYSITASGEKVKDYRRRFSSLELGGVAFRNVSLNLTDFGRDFGPRTQLLVGMDLINRMHVYISRKDKTIYATARDAHDVPHE